MDDTNGNHDGGKTKDDQRDNCQVYFQRTNLNQGRSKIHRYQQADPRTVWKCRHSTNYAEGKETRSFWTYHKLQDLCNRIKDSVGNSIRSCSGKNCDREIQRGTEATTTGWTWQEKTHLEKRPHNCSSAETRKEANGRQCGTVLGLLYNSPWWSHQVPWEEHDPTRPHQCILPLQIQD